MNKKTPVNNVDHADNTAISKEITTRINERMAAMNEVSAVPDKARSALPALLAFFFALTVTGFLVIIHITYPSEKRLSDSAKVRQTIIEWTESINTNNYPSFSQLTCKAVLRDGPFDDTASFDNHFRDRISSKGTLVVEDITGVTVAGTQAQATMVFHYAKYASQTQKTLIKLEKELTAWLLCSPTLKTL